MTTPAVKCFCERPSRIATSNTTANPGRQFELCATGECAYWAWCDNEGIAGIRCSCSRIVRILTAGPGAMLHNRGRDFARCAHPENDLRCGFLCGVMDKIRRSCSTNTWTRECRAMYLQLCDAFEACPELWFHRNATALWIRTSTGVLVNPRLVQMRGI
ncbi:hypothetical protein B0H17DRAFT_1187609 [Mycena rosella]|uniref:GRF-type domain-containing protein n=1 Tax=Mycena rosella TaxID=1033263 RepID=A0AAD7FM61_MYCRO|nr:hypothetical protein B0H17DRAFT_1187609 [Mycena rosella]